MSRIGKKPITIPSGVTATVAGQKVKIDMPALQLTSPEKGEEDRVQTVTFSIRPTPSAGNDEVKLTFS